MAEALRGGSAVRESPEQSSGAPRSSPVSRRGRLAAIVRSVYSNDRRLQLALLVFMLVCYGALLGISRRLSWPIDPLNLTFNSMLAHLLDGRFDVDPRIVGWEGFVRNGRVYAYWGIWCALLRLPLWILRRIDLDVTLWSCLAAICIAGMAKVRAVLLIRRHAANPVSGRAIALLLAFVLLAGSAVCYLEVSIYQEVVFWAYALAALFVYLAVKSLLNRAYDLGTLNGMAVCAGLAMLARVSIGIGLILAALLLLLVLALRSRTKEFGGRWAPIPRLGRAFTQRRILIPLGILAACIAATGAVNYLRWGNPATFANYDLYISNTYHPDWLLRLHRYGLFNLERVPFGLMYYFFPIDVLRGRDGQFLFHQTQTRLFDAAEPPPGSLLLTDLLPLCFIVLLAIALWRRRSRVLLPFGQCAAAVAAGLLAPGFLMLSAIFLAYRYRMEFCPEIEFLAFLGLYLTVTDKSMLALFARRRAWFSAALVVSIVSSFGSLTLYMLSPNWTQEQLSRGYIRYYWDQAAQHYHRAMELYFPAHR